MSVRKSPSILLAVLVYLASMVPPGSGGLATADGGDGTSSSVGVGPDADYDAIEYAKTVGVSFEEATWRLALQPQVGRLNQALRESWPGFAGLYINHQPRFGVVVLGTDIGGVHVGELIERYGLQELVEMRTVGHTLRDLEEDQDTMTRLLVDTPGALADIDIRSNRTVLEVLAESETLSRVQSGGLKLPSSMVVEVTQELPRPATAFYGGLALSSCTSGFTIYYGNDTAGRGVATAGHCSTIQWYSGVRLTYMNDKKTSGNYDVESFTLAGASYPNLIYDSLLPNPLTRQITGKVYWVNQNDGDFVCHYGMITGWGCGYVVSTYNPGCMTTSGNRYVKVDSDPSGTGYDLSEPGDSGGPWFSGYNAYGIMSCQQGYDAIYETVGYVEVGLNAHILTSP